MTTEPAMCFMSRFPARTQGALGLILAALSVYFFYDFAVRRVTLHLVGAILFAAYAAWSLNVFRVRSRPVLEIIEGRVVYGSVVDFRRRSLPLDAVEEVGSVSRLSGKLALRLRSGKVVRIPLRELGSERRARAVDALRRHVATRGTTGESG